MKKIVELLRWATTKKERMSSEIINAIHYAEDTADEEIRELMPYWW